MNTIKIKCGCDGGNVSYDVDGHAVEHKCSDCDGRGFNILQVVPFCDFAKAFERISATPVYNEMFAGDCLQPFELHMKWTLIHSSELKTIQKISDSLGLDAGLITKSNGLAFYFVTR